MKEWLRISMCLCLFGFIREIRPSESFMSVFILGPWRNISADELNREIFPVGTYSYLGQSFLVFLITDYLRYKPLIILCGFSGIAMSSLLIWSKSKFALQVMEFIFGTYMASEVAYYTYIYAKVDKEFYPKVTSHTRAALLVGRLVASVMSQVLVSSKMMDYMQLNYITFTAQCCATFWAFLLPNVQTSIYFHRKSNENLEKPIRSCDLLWLQFKNAYTNKNVVVWSAWYALGLGGYLNYICYMQMLWNEIEEDPEMLWNGAVDAILTFFGSLFALLAGVFHAGLVSRLKGISALAVLSSLHGAAVFLTCYSKSLFGSYFGYVIFGAIFSYTITITSAEVAKFLTDESYGLVFGINTVGGLLVQTILTIAVVSGGGFALSVRGQYVCYGYYFLAVGVGYFLYVVWEWRKERNVG